MVPFKFRVWDTIRKEMMYQPLADLEDLYIGVIDGEIYENFRGDDDSLRPTHGRYELSQFTGLLDCDGKQIYDGDVCTYHYTDRHEIEFNGSAIIYWDKINCGFSLTIIKDSRDDTRSQMSLFSVSTGRLRLNIIGNKFESPELLEVKND